MADSQFKTINWNQSLHDHDQSNIFSIVDDICNKNIYAGCAAGLLPITKFQLGKEGAVVGTILEVTTARAGSRATRFSSQALLSFEYLTT